MSEYMQTKYMKMKLLTPLHISDGYEGELMPTEYVIDAGGQLHKIDLARLISCFPDDSLVTLNKYMDGEDLPGIRNFIKSLWHMNPGIFDNCSEYSMNAGDLEDFYRNMQDESVESQFTFTPFIRTAKKIFLPGSSIKGAIRTAFINELFKTPIAFNLDEAKGKIDKNALELEQNILNYSYKDKRGQHKPITVKDPFKALKISDAFVPSGGSIVHKVDIVQKNKAGQFNCTDMKDVKVYAEFLREGIVIDVEIRLDSRYFGNHRSIGRNLSFQLLTNSCRAFYKKVLIHERDDFFHGFDKAVGNSKISILYDDFLKLNEQPNAFLLRIGKHIGRNSISFNLSNVKGVEPKSRKLIIKNGEYWPLGWVMVTE